MGKRKTKTNGKIKFPTGRSAALWYDTGTSGTTFQHWRLLGLSHRITYVSTFALHSNTITNDSSNHIILSELLAFTPQREKRKEKKRKNEIENEGKMNFL